MFEEKDGRIAFDRCPMCGAKEKVMAAFVQQEVIKGKIMADRQPCSQVKCLPVIDPATGARISAPVVWVYYDFCAKCGFEYPAAITWKEMPAHQIDILTGAKQDTGRRVL